MADSTAIAARRAGPVLGMCTPCDLQVVSEGWPPLAEAECMKDL